jgi:hypothetical protein
LNNSHDERGFPGTRFQYRLGPTDVRSTSFSLLAATSTISGVIMIWMAVLLKHCWMIGAACFELRDGLDWIGAGAGEKELGTDPTETSTTFRQ